MRLQRRADGKLLTLDTATPLGKGGEAGVYKVVGDPTLAAKVYAPGKDLTERLAKLEVMLRNPPEIPGTGLGNAPVAWPLDLLCKADGPMLPVGFLMPRVHGAAQVIDYYNPLTRLEKSPLFDYRYLLRAARNLAATVRALHARDYVLGDLKHSNVLVTETALVTLVDTDSFQVRDPETGLHFPCPVHTPDFTPPELQEARDEWLPLTPAQDNFGLAVMLFQLLMEGTHPFAGVYDGEEDPPPFEERIAKGHFPYGTRSVPCRPGTRVAPPFALLPPPIQELFVRCFEEGYTDPLQRPDAKTWQTTLDEATRTLARCDANPQHFYSNHQEKCPWCERKQTQLRGLDPFPSEQAVRENRHLPKPPPRPQPIQPMPVAAAPTNNPASYTPPAQSSLISRVAVALLSMVFGVCGLLGVAAIGSAVFGGCMNTQTYGYYGYESARTAIQENRKVQAVAWSPDGKTYYGGDTTFYAWDANSDQIVHTFPSNRVGTGGMALSSDGKTMASYSGSTISIWNTATGDILKTLSCDLPIDTMTLSPDGKTLVVSRTDSITLWNVKTGKQTDHLDCGVYSLSCLRYSPNGMYLAACGNKDDQGGVLKVWNVYDGMKSQAWRSPKSIRTLAFSQDSKMLACGGEEIHIFHPQEASKPLFALEDTYAYECQALAFSPDTSKLAIGNTTSLQIWNMKTREKILSDSSIMNFESQAVAYSPNGKVLLTGSSGGALRRYDAITGELIASASLPVTP